MRYIYIYTIIYLFIYIFFDQQRLQSMISNITTQAFFLPACINPFHSTLTNQQIAEDIFVKIAFVGAPYVWNIPFVGLSWDVPQSSVKQQSFHFSDFVPKIHRERGHVYINNAKHANAAYIKTVLYYTYHMYTYMYTSQAISSESNVDSTLWMDSAGCFTFKLLMMSNIKKDILMPRALEYNQINRS